VRKELSRESASDRARWLAELAEALDSAQVLAWQLTAEGRAEARDLYSRLETVRAEVEALRAGRVQGKRDELSPEWSNFTPWSPEG